ncbi:MAG: MBL fold metallo-hydrolase [Armatimonadota bacterium]
MRRVLALLLMLGLSLHGISKEVREMVDQIHWLGHDAFRIAASKVIYIDPYQLKAGQQPADIILITHKHHDHSSPDDVRAVQQAATVVIGPADSLEKIAGDTRAITVGETLKIGEVEITAVPAYNIGKAFHPKNAGWVGYLVKIDGVAIYHAGDTDHIPEMKQIHPDIALLPVGGKYTMTAEEAAQAAEDLRPQVAIPMHYGAIIGQPADAERFRQLLRDKVAVVIKTKE